MSAVFRANRAGLGSKLERETAVRDLSKLKLTLDYWVAAQLQRERKRKICQFAHNSHFLFPHRLAGLR